MFHRVLPQRALRQHLLERPRFQVSDEFFEHVLMAMRVEKYRFVTLDELVARLASRRSVHRLACVTFDDGFSDIVHHALPTLERRDVPFTAYVTTGYPDRQLIHISAAIEDLVRDSEHVALELPNLSLRLDTSSPNSKVAAVKQIEQAVFSRFTRLDEAVDALGFDRARYKACALSWEQIAALASHPLCTIGAHTVSHPDLTTLGTLELARELDESNRRLERFTGRRPSHFAYPFGRYDALVREAGFRAGYRVMVKTGRACVDPSDFDLGALPRACPLEVAQS